MKKKYLSFGFSVVCALALALVAYILFTANVRNSEVAVFVPKGATHEQLLDSLRKYEVLKSEFRFKATSELLLYKARYLYDLGDCPAAKNCFCAGYYLLACRYSREDADKEALDILGDSRFAALRQA